MALIPSVLSSAPVENLNVRRSVNLNFYPPSNSTLTSRGDFWSGTGNSGGLMLARSLLWASKKSSGTVRVYYLHATSTASWVTDVTTNIQSYVSASLPGITFSITTDQGGVNISTLTTANYDVCLISSDSTPGSWGGQLASFALAGGGLVLSTFANASQTISGFPYDAYTPIQAPAGNQSLNSTMNVSSIVTHPITVGLSSLTFTNPSYGGSGVALSTGATSIVNYAQGSSLITVKSVNL